MPDIEAFIIIFFIPLVVFSYKTGKSTSFFNTPYTNFTSYTLNLNSHILKDINDIFVLNKGVTRNIYVNWQIILVNCLVMNIAIISLYFFLLNIGTSEDNAKSLGLFVLVSLYIFRFIKVKWQDIDIIHTLLQIAMLLLFSSIISYHISNNFTYLIETGLLEYIIYILGDNSQSNLGNTNDGGPSGGGPNGPNSSKPPIVHQPDTGGDKEDMFHPYEYEGEWLIKKDYNETMSGLNHYLNKTLKNKQFNNHKELNVLKDHAEKALPFKAEIERINSKFKVSSYNLDDRIIKFEQLIKLTENHYRTHNSLQNFKPKIDPVIHVIKD